MKNWSTDEKRLRKYPEKYAIWKLESLINFGLGKKKLKRTELKKYWDKIDIDSSKRKFLNLLLK